MHVQGQRTFLAAAVFSASFAGSELLTLVLIRIQVFWDITSCRLKIYHSTWHSIEKDPALHPLVLFLMCLG